LVRKESPDDLMARLFDDVILELVTLIFLTLDVDVFFTVVLLLTVREDVDVMDLDVDADLATCVDDENEAEADVVTDTDVWLLPPSVLGPFPDPGLITSVVVCLSAILSICC
jgi:hypothetical protein